MEHGKQTLMVRAIANFSCLADCQEDKPAGLHDFQHCFILLEDHVDGLQPDISVIILKWRLKGWCHERRSTSRRFWDLIIVHNNIKVAN
eukprot:139502-Pelagomonas_calceolata.AAC.2